MKPPKDIAWPPLGVRDLKPDVRPAAPRQGKFSTLKDALTKAGADKKR